MSKQHQHDHLCCCHIRLRLLRTSQGATVNYISPLLGTTADQLLAYSYPRDYSKEHLLHLSASLWASLLLLTGCDSCMQPNTQTWAVSNLCQAPLRYSTLLTYSDLIMALRHVYGHCSRIHDYRHQGCLMLQAVTPARKPTSRRRLSPHLKKNSPDSSKQFQPQRTTLKLHIALGLYDLADSELFWELQRDTRCLMGWSDDKIVVAFRGTASMTNAWSDVQVSIAASATPARSCQ